MTYQNPGNNYGNMNMVQPPMMVSGGNNNRASNDDNCCDVSCCACSGCGCFYWLIVFIIAIGISFQSGVLVANPEHESARHWKSCLEFLKENAEKGVGNKPNDIPNPNVQENQEDALNSQSDSSSNSQSDSSSEDFFVHQKQKGLKLRGSGNNNKITLQ